MQPTTVAGPWLRSSTLKSDEIGLKATVNGNNLVLKGDNVQTLTINNETEAGNQRTTLLRMLQPLGQCGKSTKYTWSSPSKQLTSKMWSHNQLQIHGTATATKDATVSHTIATGDTGVKIAQALADKLKAHATATAYDAASAAGVKAAASGNDGTITLAAALNVGDATITVSRTDDNDLFRANQTSGTGDHHLWHDQA